MADVIDITVILSHDVNPHWLLRSTPRSPKSPDRRHRVEQKLHWLHSHPSSGASRLRTASEHYLATLHPRSPGGLHRWATVHHGSVSGHHPVASRRSAQPPVCCIHTRLDNRADHARRDCPPRCPVAATTMASAAPPRPGFPTGRRGRVPALHHSCADNARLPGGTPPTGGRIVDRRTPEVRSRPCVSHLPARAIPGSTRQCRVGSSGSARSNQIRLGT